MASRKSNKLTTIAICSILAFAAYGVYTFWQKKDVQKTVNKIEKSVKAAKKVW